MSEVMSMGNLGEIPQTFGEKPQHLGDLPQFWRICRRAFDSGEEMADYLAGFGIDVSPNTCRNYMSGETEPGASRTIAILAIVDAKLEQEIKERRERRERIRRIYAR